MCGVWAWFCVGVGVSIYEGDLEDVINSEGVRVHVGCVRVRVSLQRCGYKGLGVGVVMRV